MPKRDERFIMRLPPGLRALLDEAAASEGVPLATWVKLVLPPAAEIQLSGGDPLAVLRGAARRARTSQKKPAQIPLRVGAL